MSVQFCIRDDDTSFFTAPQDLERAYADITRRGPVSLAIIPFCRAGMSKGVPESHRASRSIHPLHENEALVKYLRQGIRDGRFEAMLHGYHHDEPDGSYEFVAGSDLRRKVAHGRRYLEDVLSTTVRVFVPPHNAIRREGLRAIAAEGLHLAGVAGLRSGWPWYSVRSWEVWFELRAMRGKGPFAPRILDLGDHRELPGQAVTPLSSARRNRELLEETIAANGVFCAATHYWEFDAVGCGDGEPTVAEQLRQLVDRVAGEPAVQWLTVGEVVSNREGMA